MSSLSTLKLVALDIDGVALKDTFSPVIHQLVTSWGGAYTRDIERNVFSQPRNRASEYLKNKFKINLSTDEIIDLYFTMRREYIASHDHGPVEGLDDFLRMIQSLGLRIICYGGLGIEYFYREMVDYEHYFDGIKYICTNDFRPGIEEICTKFFFYEYRNVLFLDDVNLVAEEAKSKGAAFIGVPSSFEFGFQRHDMMETGVKCLVSSVRDVTEKMIRQINADAENGSLWKRER